MSALSRKETAELLRVEGAELFDLLARAGRARLEHRGDEVLPCAIVNAKCGHCSQDCSFCAQSSRSDAGIERFPLISSKEMIDGARNAAEAGALRIGIVTSGRATSRDAELGVMSEAIGRIAKELTILPCASLGILDETALRRLADAGLTRYHHNLETAESFYPEVCSTRSWRDSIETVEAASRAGLSICCGALFGLGESLEQRAEVLETIAALDVESVPLNFLHPIAGTPLEGLRELTPFDCLKIVAVARLMMPGREIRVCGGREHNLRDLQSWVLLAGANGVMVGGYLTTSGRVIADDMQMFADAGLRVPAAARRDKE